MNTEGKLFNSTICTIATRDGRLSREVEAIAKHCRMLIKVVGCSDVAQARNVQLNRALGAANKREGIDSVLMLDDDMCLSFSDVEKLKLLADKARCVAFGMYCDAQGRPCFMRTQKGPFLAGLGAWCIPIQALRDVSEDRQYCDQENGEPFLAFTESRPVDIDGKFRWLSEDYFLSVVMDSHGWPLIPGPIVGHRKNVALYLDESVAQAVRDSADAERLQSPRTEPQS